MRVGIYDLKDPNGLDLSVHKAYEQILTYNAIPSVRLRIEQVDFSKQIQGLSLFIMRFPHLDSNMQEARDILPVVEKDYGIPCFPNQATAWHYDDKVKQYLQLKSKKFPITDCWIFYDKKLALEWSKIASYPVVFKLRSGAGSMNVILIKSQSDAARLICRIFGRGIYPEQFLLRGGVRFKYFDLYRELHHIGGNLFRWSRGLDMSPFWQVHKNYVLFQKFLPGNDCDTRIAVIGDRAFGFRRLVRENDFRASGSGRIDYDKSKIDLRCVEIAFRISRDMGFQSMAYDFLKNENGEPEFCEVSYTYVSSAIHKCPGYWDRELNWYEGHWWPEHLHLIDALGLPDLQVQEMDY
jgi:glutathione synthase/RimK-type ligase-like ATP-grasp enzyme